MRKIVGRIQNNEQFNEQSRCSFKLAFNSQRRLNSSNFSDLKFLNSSVSGLPTFDAEPLATVRALERSKNESDRQAPWGSAQDSREDQTFPTLLAIVSHSSRCGRTRRLVDTYQLQNCGTLKTAMLSMLSEQKQLGKAGLASDGMLLRPRSSNSANRRLAILISRLAGLIAANSVEHRFCIRKVKKLLVKCTRTQRKL